MGGAQSTSGAQATSRARGFRTKHSQLKLQLGLGSFAYVRVQAFLLIGCVARLTGCSGFVAGYHGAHIGYYFVAVTTFVAGNRRLHRLGGLEVGLRGRKTLFA